MESTASLQQSFSAADATHSTLHKRLGSDLAMATERKERRLCVIMVADIAGYCRLMGEDEEGTLDAMTAHRGELIDPAIAEHTGRIVKATGDGLLTEFASVVDAAECAIKIQRGMAKRNRTVPASRRLIFRIGLNIGDVIVRDGDLFGDVVNIAARLEALAEPGGICLSASAFEQLRGKLRAVSFEDMGEHRVKNISRAIRAYRAALGHPDQKPPVPAAQARPSIAVLPLDSMDRDPEQEHFADGLAEDLITDLAKVAGFHVIARNSTFVYKGRHINALQVGRELGARYVVEGSVRRVHNTVRITAQLIDAESGGHIWADRYDRHLSDVLAIQDEVAHAIVMALTAELANPAPSWPTPRDAHDHISRGMPVRHH